MATLLVQPANAQRFVSPTSLRPGEFVWQPERSPDGPVVVIVSLPEQRVHVYRNGAEIGQSTCSTGKPGHRTPTGAFTILEKQRQHVSSIYKGAQMPNMERLTWGGIALHAGNLPGYPASHGCIRLPLKFSALLFDVTHRGTVVLIADERTQPNNVVHPGLLLPEVAAAEAQALGESVGKKKVPDSWDASLQHPTFSVVISRFDGMAHVSRDGALVGSYPVGIADIRKPIGTHVYSLVGPAADGSGLTWMALGLGKSRHDAHIVHWQGDAAMKRIKLHDMARAREIANSFHPGTTLVLTDAPAGTVTRTAAKDFSVISSEPGA